MHVVLLRCVEFFCEGCACQYVEWVIHVLNVVCVCVHVGVLYVCMCVCCMCACVCAVVIYTYK